MATPQYQYVSDTSPLGNILSGASSALVGIQQELSKTEESKNTKLEFARILEERGFDADAAIYRGLANNERPNYLGAAISGKATERDNSSLLKHALGVFNTDREQQARLEQIGLQNQGRAASNTNQWKLLNANDKILASEVYNYQRQLSSLDSAERRALDKAAVAESRGDWREAAAQRSAAANISAQKQRAQQGLSQAQTARARAVQAVAGESVGGQYGWNPLPGGEFTNTDPNAVNASDALLNPGGAPFSPDGTPSETITESPSVTESQISPLVGTMQEAGRGLGILSPGASVLSNVFRTPEEEAAARSQPSREAIPPEATQAGAAPDGSAPDGMRDMSDAFIAKGINPNTDLTENENLAITNAFINSRTQGNKVLDEIIKRKKSSSTEDNTFATPQEAQDSPAFANPPTGYYPVIETAPNSGGRVRVNYKKVTSSGSIGRNRTVQTDYYPPGVSTPQYRKTSTSNPDGSVTVKMLQNRNGEWVEVSGQTPSATEKTILGAGWKAEEVTRYSGNNNPITPSSPPASSITAPPVPTPRSSKTLLNEIDSLNQSGQ